MNRKQRRAAAAVARQGADTPMMQADQNYVLAYRHHELGDLESAKAHYLRALAVMPDHAGCLMGLGLIALNHKMLDEAEEFLEKAVEQEPEEPGILANLAAAKLELEKYEECKQISERALAKNPNNYQALTNLSFALRHLGDAAAAIEPARRAVDMDPKQATGLVALGTALMKWEERTDSDVAEALQLLKSSYAINPSLVAACGGAALPELMLRNGQWAEVIELLTKGDHFDDDDPDKHRILGYAYDARQDYSKAVPAAERYCELDPENAHAFAALGATLMRAGRNEEAVSKLEKALELDPNLHVAKLDLCQAKQMLCEWDGLLELQSEVVEMMKEHGNFSGPFQLISMPNPAGSAANQLMCAKISQKAFLVQARRTKDGIRTKHPREKLNRKLRIGYLSNDYRQHATASLIAELIERHDRDQFEIVAYCYTLDDESVFRNRLKRSFHKFRYIRDMSDAEAAKLIEEDEIDILVDLKGYTQGSRTTILTYRPAPIQVNYLGYPGTLGLDCVDYIIGDEFLTPMDSQEFYSERIVQLPDCYQPNDRKRPLDPRLTRREDYGLPRNAFVFCSFNNINKLTREVFQVWMRLLQQVPESVFWIFTGSRTVMENLRREARACGVDADRLVFAERQALPQHIARMKLADLFLDSFPCTAHTTASEAMWAGLPLLTCAGETFSSRVAGSILTAAGLPELVTNSLEEYEAKALALARDPAALEELRERAKNCTSSPLFDTLSYTRNLEKAYLGMAAIYNDGREPEGITVRALDDSIHPDAQFTTSQENAMSAALLEKAKIAEVADAEQAPKHERVKFDICPLCYSDDVMPMGRADCSRHTLYKPQLPDMINWRMCKSCNHVHADGFFDAEAYSVIYPRTPPKELAGYDIERQRLNAAAIVNQVGRFVPAGNWLDVGFGDGSVLLAAQEFGYGTVGLDIRGDNVEAMKEFGIEAYELCLEQFNPAVQFDVISMINVLQHVPFPGSAVEHAARVIKPKGIFHLVLPNMATSVWEAMDKQKNNPFWADMEIYHHFTRDRLYKLLAQHGFGPVAYNISERFRCTMEVTAIKIPDGA